jgi:ethanolamine utilization protein EutQ (cupin superfamily)
MPKVKHFSVGDLDMKPTEDGPVHAVVNAGYSAELGAGIGVFENCAIPWTVTYDEVLFIKDGRLDLRVGKKLYRAGAGDILWIPAGTALVYEAKKKVTFFYAVHPVSKSPSSGLKKKYPTTPPV